MPPALTGLKVVDLSHVLAGPFCTMLLGDMGAEVIKVEEPTRGDHARGWIPFWNGVSSHFLAFNRNKRSITVNLKDPRGVEICRRLATHADVFVESFRTGTVERMGIDYATLRKTNPGLVYCAISGFGRSGPLAERPGYDLIAQAYGGLMSMTGDADGQPVRAGYSVADLFTGLAAYAAVTTALVQRGRTGHGQYVEASLLESMVSLMSYHAVGHLATGARPTRTGSSHPSLTPYQAFPSADGHLVVGCSNDPMWRKLCVAIERPDLMEDPRFLTNSDRVRNRMDLVEILSEVFRRATTAAWLSRIAAAGVPCSPLQTVPEVIADPQVVARKMMVAIDHPDIPGLKVPEGPMRLADSPRETATPPPRLGEHTAQVLGELGYATTAIEELHAARVV